MKLQSPLCCTASVGILLVHVAFASAAPAIGGHPASDPTDVDTLVKAALAQNRSLDALRARIAALQQGVRKAGAWLDPRLGIEYSNMPIDAWRPGKHPMSGIQLKLSQTFYYPGKIAAREAVERAKVKQTRAALGEQKVRLRAAVRRAWIKLALVRQLRDVTRQHIKLVEQFLDVVKVKYQVGKAGQHDYIRLQVLEQKLRDDLKAFDRDERAFLSAINAVLRRRLTTAIITPRRLAALVAPRDVKALVGLARGSRPALRQLDAIFRTRRAEAKRWAREGYPDITAWIGYRFRFSSTDNGVDFVSLGVSVPLPFSYSRRSGSERDKKLHLARAALEQRQAQLDEIRGQLGIVIAEWRRAEQKARTYRRSLMPLAHRALDATFAAYQVDRADFASLFQSELQLLDFERAIVRSKARTHLAHVGAEALVGQSLPRQVVRTAGEANKPSAPVAPASPKTGSSQ